jgi:hypothetical protein
MKFSTRDLFLVTLIVALAVGWWVDRSRLALANSQLESEFEELRVGIEVDEVRMMAMERKLDSLEPAWRTLPTSQAIAPNPPKK